MCTFTAIALENPEEKIVRLVFNRDELRTRKKALDPDIFQKGFSRCIMPLDAESRGTWMGVNDASLAFCLLNVNTFNRETSPVRKGLLSRGSIIPSLLECRDLNAVRNRMENISPENYPGFRLICLDAEKMDCETYTWDEKTMQQNQFSWRGDPLFYTSSGLGDEYVFLPRQEIFSETFRKFDGSQKYRKIQDEFHMQRDEDRKDVSVFMERKNALTVSRSVIEIRKSRILFQYFSPADAEDPVLQSLDLQSI